MEAQTVKLKINGIDVECEAGRTILEVVRERNLDDIPTLCHSPELEPYGSCFLCVVEVKGRWNLLPSCATRVAEGMEVATRNERIESSRRTALELLLSNHYADCVSPCSEGCPAHVDCQGYLALAAMGQYGRAIELIRENNPLPAICGRVCVRKCELTCRREDVDEAVGINAVKRFVSDTPGIYDKAPECAPETGKTVGIVGSGPAGLTAAWFLGRLGHKPVIYEAQEKAGGMLRYGIPEYRLPDAVIDKEVDYICRAGAEIRYGKRIGSDVSIDELMDVHDAVFMATGAWTGKPMGVEGESEVEGVVQGTDWLREKAINPKPVSGTIVVVGGGNTAMDVSRTAWRLGAEKVIVLYRRTKDEMPADKIEIRDCFEEGIELLELAAPVGLIAPGGKLEAIRCLRMKLGEPDLSGRRRPVPIEDSEFNLPCRMAVSAIGQAPVLDGLTTIKGEKLEITRWNTIVVDKNTLATNIRGLYAGGDAADDGPAVVIDAIADGQRVAGAIHEYLTGEIAPKRSFIVTKEFWGKPENSELGKVKESPRHEVHMIDVSDRHGNFSEVASAFEYEDLAHECERCLSCGCVRYSDCDLRRYAEEYGVDMERFRGYVRKHRVDSRHPYIQYDPNKCVLCARCIRTCSMILPIAALGLVGRGFKTEMRPAMDDPLVETSCVSCGNCVDSCPTGALTIKYPFPGRASLKTEDIESHCGFCSLACKITVRKFNGNNRYFIGPSGIPGEYLCRYGRFGPELFIRKNRLRGAEVRTKGSRSVVTMEDAVSASVKGLKNVIEKYSPGRIGVFVSPELTNEEFFIAGKIAREGLGTNNIASLSVLGTGNKSGVLDASFGFTASTSDRSCLRDADLIVCSNTSLESDHLVLSVDVIRAVKSGAKLIVSNSTLDTTDQVLSALTMDPMRGRNAILWNGIMQLLIDEGWFNRELLLEVDASDDFLRDRDFNIKRTVELSGIDERVIRKAAEIIRDSNKVVFIHSLDRARDHAPADAETLANFVTLLRAKGVEADLLLPRLYSNSAGLEIMGIDPEFRPGKIAGSGGAAGSETHEDLIAKLENGEISGAILLGEDPMAWPKSGSWFRNIEFLVAMDWTESETTRIADVVLPGSTCLETEGTRCNFEGNLVKFERAIEPPSGLSGVDVLKLLAEKLGVEVPANITLEIDSLVSEKMRRVKPFYWNTGEKREFPERLRLVPIPADVRPVPIPPALTHGEIYKKEIRDVGTERFRVRNRQ